MCWNFSNGEISVTDYAKRLGINELLYRQVFLSIFKINACVMHFSDYIINNKFVAIGKKQSKVECRI